VAGSGDEDAFLGEWEHCDDFRLRHVWPPLPRHSVQSLRKKRLESGLAVPALRA
jgi:hypothetical protein